MITRSEIVREAREWLNTPFAHQGRQKGVGCDCVGLAKGVADRLGIYTSDLLGYTKQPNPDLMLGKLKENLDEIYINDAMEGDIYYMYILNQPTHIAIKTDQGIIHSHNAVGKVVEQGLDKKWKRRIVRAFRFRGVN